MLQSSPGSLELQRGMALRLICVSVDLATLKYYLPLNDGVGADIGSNRGCSCECVGSPA